MASLQDQTENKDVRRLPIVGILLIIGCAVLILLAAWGASLLPPLLNYGIWIGIALIPAINGISQPCAYLFRRSRADAVLLNLGYVHRFSSKDIVAFVLLVIPWLVLFILWINLFSGTPIIVIMQFGLLALYISIAAAKFVASSEPTLVAEKGIFGPEGRILWNKIESHEWFMQHGDGLLVAKLKGRPWPLDAKKLRIPALLMADVDKILREKILN
jgi:hypothetical protein